MVVNLYVFIQNIPNCSYKGRSLVFCLVQNLNKPMNEIENKFKILNINLVM